MAVSQHIIIPEAALPQGWNFQNLGDVIKRPPSYGINAAAVPLRGDLPVYLRITDISDRGQLDASKPVSVDHPNATHYLLAQNDIVFARTGASTGKSYFYDGSDGPLVFAGFLLRISPDLELVDPSFLSFAVRTKRFDDWLREVSQRSGQPGINGAQLASFSFSAPPLLEQKTIAAVLGDIDDLIASLDTLIAKKRDFKQAATQQLLTGKTRLPGFDREWSLRRLSEFGTFVKGSGIRRDQAQSGDIPCVRYGEIYTTHENVIRQFASRISPEVAATATRLRFGDLLFAGSGETKEEIGKCVAFASSGEAYAGGDIVIFRQNWGNPVFLGYLMNTAPVIRQKANQGQGDAVVHISANALSTIEAMMPDPNEQGAIASVLTDMDAELSMLNAKREKAGAIKIGMMQQLLTGRIRLI